MGFLDFYFLTFLHILSHFGGVCDFSINFYRHFVEGGAHFFQTISSPAFLICPVVLQGGRGGVGSASWYLGRTQILIYMIYMVINIIFDNFEINPLIRTEVRKTGG